ncbi:MAG: hypothetical protein DMF92_20025, partial [Acidobacteria bacterium]
MDLTRRTILATGAAATAMAVAPRLFAQQAGKGGTGKFYEKGSARIYYEEAGSGFPLMLLPGGGLNSTISFFTGNAPFNAIEEFKGEYRCITADLRNAPTGRSTGPVEVDRPWDSYADDQLGLMDHLGIDKFMVMGFCIGGPFIWSLLKRAPDRIVAAVLAQPVGWRPEMRDPKYPGVFWNSWGPALTAQRPEVTMPMVDKFVTRMFGTNPDFVFTVTRDFVRGCQNPVLVLPDDVPAHPYAVAMECAMLAPKAEVSMFPWKEPKERIPLAVRQIHSFLKAHRSALTAVSNSIRIIPSVGVRKRIGTQLELGCIGRGSLAAFAVPRRAAAKRRPQSPGAPPTVGIVDAPLHSLREERHRVRDGDVDPLPIRERLHPIGLIVEDHHRVFAQSEDVMHVDPDVIRACDSPHRTFHTIELRSRQRIECEAFRTMIPGGGGPVANPALAAVEADQV